MNIPTFSNGDLLQTVRERSLNPTIAKVNTLTTEMLDLEARIGTTPTVIHTLDDVHPTGWYYFQPPAVGPVPEGFVQYYTLYAEEHVPTYSRCTLYSKGGSCKIYLRDWSPHIHWGEWICLGAGGFRLEPNPGVEGRNYFKGDNRAAAEAARDAALTGGKLTPYDNDAMLLIMLEWTDAGKVVVIFQGRSGGKWIEPFGEIATEFQLGNHDATELRDWSTWSQKIFSAAKSLNNIGDATGVELANLVGGALSISKMGSGGTVIPHKADDGTVNFYTKGFWVGYFDTVEALDNAVPSEARIPTVTTAAVKDGNIGYVTKVWTGTSWETTILVGGGIYEDSDTRKHNYKYLKDGPNITFSLASATGALQANVKDVMTSADVVEFLKKSQLHAGEWIKLTTTAGTDNITIDGRPTPVEFKSYIKEDESDVIATTSSAGDQVKLNFVQPKLKTQVSNILKSDNNNSSDDLLGNSDTITFTKEVAGGRDVIKANVIAKVGSIQAKVGDASSIYSTITKLDVKDTFASITDGTLSLPATTSVNRGGSDLGIVKTIKEGSNITLDNSNGVLTVSAAKENFTGQVGTQAAQSITGIKAASPYATITNKILEIPVIRGTSKVGTDLGPIKAIKGSANITLSNASGVLTLSTAAKSTISVTLENGTTAEVADISPANPYATISDGTLNLPVITAVDTNDAEIAKVKNIKQGNGIRFANTEGVVTISATGGTGRVSGKIGSTTNAIDTISIADGAGVFKDSGSTLHINPVEGVIGGNTKVLKKIEVLQNTSGDSSMDNTGKLTIKIPAPGGSGGASLNISGKTTDGTVVSDTQINKITLGEGITFSESPSSLEAKLTSLLEVTGKDLDDQEKPIVTQKVTKVEFGDGLDTEIVSESGKPSYAKIKAVNLFQGSASGGSKPIDMQPVDQLLIVGDSDLSYTSTVSGKKQLTIETYNPVISENDKASLSTNHPAADNSGRLSFTSDNEALYISSGNAWKDLCYAGMGTHVSNLLKRYPEKLKEVGETYDESLHKELRFTHISSTSAKNDLGLPEETAGVLMNLYAGTGTGSTENTWIQKYFCFATGDEFTRYRATTSPSPTWSRWRKVLVSIGVLEDSNYAAMVMDNDVSLSGMMASGQVPYLIHTDPSANFVMIEGNKGSFQVKRGGVYNLRCLAQFTNEPNTSITGGDVTVELKSASAGENPVATATFTKATIFDDATKSFYPMMSKFDNVQLDLGETYNIKITLTGASASDQNNLRFDPYKNMLSIDPATSRTKTGEGIVKMLYRTLAGISYSTGYEVRTEFKDNIIRVFGEKYLSEIKEKVSY